MTARGVFITLEGIDGSGKSTQARRLAEALRAEGRDVALTREPGGSPGAEEIRRLLVEGDPDRWSAETEILLFTAARRDHLEKTIRPALAAGRIQGAARGDLRAFVDRLHQMTIGIEPDLTLVIDMEPEAALARGLARNSGEDRFEDLGAGFQARLRAGFLALAAAHPERCRLIDGNREANAVARDIRAAVAAVLP